MGNDSLVGRGSGTTRYCEQSRLFMLTSGLRGPKVRRLVRRSIRSPANPTASCEVGAAVYSAERSKRLASVSRPNLDLSPFTFHLSHSSA
jgi:hypothetical protein